MPEWTIEPGIGETRAVLIDQGAIVEARILLDDQVAAGTILAAKLKSVGRNAVAIAGGTDYLLPKGAPGQCEGATIAIEVTREAIGTEAWKRPLARVTDRAPGASLPLAGRTIPSISDLLDESGWLDLIEEARSRVVPFPGGELRIAVTPAMTVIDVDGARSPDELAVAGARAAALAIRRHGIGGSIGIDLPTAGGKTARQAATDAIDATLPQPFERTAVNGFGFVQIIRSRRHASLFELALDRPAFEARALLRTAARAVGGAEIVAHPAVIAAIRAPWVDQLARRIGGTVRLRGDPGLGMGGGHVAAR